MSEDVSPRVQAPPACSWGWVWGNAFPVAWGKGCECTDTCRIVCQCEWVSVDLYRVCVRVWLGIGSAYGLYGYRA